MWGSVQAGGGGGGLKYEETLASATDNTEYTINCGFEPKKIFIYSVVSGSACCMIYYDRDNVSQTQYVTSGATSATLKISKMQNIGDTSGNLGALTAVSSTSFKFALKNRNVITGPVYITALG